MRRLLPLIGFVLLVGACSADAATNSTFERIPTAIAVDWVNAVAGADAMGIEEAVDQRGLIVVMAAENGYSLEETAGMLQGGVAAETSDGYWKAFREEFASFAGTPFRDLEVGVFEEFSSGDREYAVVTLRGTDGDGSVVARRGPAGWQIDMVATIGPAFAGQMRNLAEQMDESTIASVVAAAFDEPVLPGLMAAAHLDPDNDTLQAEIARIERALAAVSASE
jgi:hypothetical protein